MGTNASRCLVDATPPEEVGVEAGRVGSKTGWGAALPFSCRYSSGRECLEYASEMGRRENAGAPALLGSARSVTGNARLRCVQNMPMNGSRSGASAGLIPGHRDSWGRAL